MCSETVIFLHIEGCEHRLSVLIKEKQHGRKFDGSLPDYLIIGAQKCATTSLFLYLQQHPAVRPPARKEIHFFDSNFGKGVDWYRRQFPAPSIESAQRSITGEASPSYLLNPHSARRIKQTVPNVKLIVSLRDPVERAFSHYRHMVRSQKESRPFDQAIRAHTAMSEEWRKVLSDENYPDMTLRDYSYVLRGYYLDQIKRYLNLFDRTDLHVILYDDIVSDTQAVMNNLCDFLGLERFQFDVHKHFNVGINGQIPQSARDALALTYREANTELFKFLGRRAAWH